jgi:NADH dehydrogenase FAD-containing subunit
MIPYKATFGTRFVQAKVVGVDFVKKVVTMDVGDPIFYTDLVSVLAVLVVLKYLN